MDLGQYMVLWLSLANDVGAENLLVVTATNRDPPGYQRGCGVVEEALSCSKRENVHPCQQSPEGADSMGGL